MSWFHQNRFLGTFAVVFGVAFLAAIYFLWSARSSFAEAKDSFDRTAAELNTLQRHTPFPNEPNLRKMKTQAEDYAAELNKLKEELKTRVLPVTPMAPNEFQSRLRQAITSLTEKARANRVKLPENFFLGFDEFAAALPDTEAAPLLGQQLAQAELLMNILIDARVEAVTSFRRVAATDRPASAPTPTPPPAARKPPGAPAAPPLIQPHVVETSFLSSPAAARRVLNQISTVNQQFYIIRTLHVLNEKDKGPARDGEGDGTAAAAAPGVSPATGLTFIVGNERIQTSARIEMLRFTF